MKVLSYERIKADHKVWSAVLDLHMMINKAEELELPKAAVANLSVALSALLKAYEELEAK